MNIYKIKSDLFTGEDYVVADDTLTAIAIYVSNYSDRYMSSKNITSIERIGEKCLISGK